SLCGCSTDAVARAVDARLESAEHQAVGVREDSVHDLLGQDRDATRAATDAPAFLLLRNPAARSRSGVAVVELTTKIADAPVGPGSKPPVLPKSTPTFVPDGLAVQVLSASTTFARTESPRAYPDNDVVLRQRALV